MINWFKGLTVKKEPNDGKGEAEQIVKSLHTVLKELKLKYHEGKKEHSNDGCLFRQNFEVDGDRFVLKTHYGYETKYFSSVIWDRHEQHIVVVLTMGFLKHLRVAQGIAKERLSKWLTSKT